MNWKQVLKSYDYLLALVTIGIGIFSVVMIYASIHADGIPASVTADHYTLWSRQRLFIITGGVLMIALSFIDYHYITRFYIYIYGIMIALLIVVLLIGADDATNVARWLWIPFPFVGWLSMQPSEFAKIFMIISMAKFLDIHHDRFNKPLWLGVVLLGIAVPVFLVVLQPSLSAGLVILSITMIILFIGGLYYRTILVGLILLAPIGVMVWFDMQRAEPLFLTRFLGDFQWRRIEIFLDPTLSVDAFRQTQGSLYAIGTGGLTGRGFLENPFVILGHNDFIFSVVASQFGFVGAVLLLASIGFIIVRCIFIALRAVDLEGRLIAAGVAGMLIVETFFHVGVATNLLPNTGMPFPFLSYGGSMIWVHMIAIGIVLNVGLPRKPKSIFEDEEDA
ncbi:MAG: FtsW/RodA/SpoVE family cell cycle protein [Defluviitaleaceae bacterium]|nr:FtsW/RodA/SpoVE family cell cycle protein [Defluviitaleaceae bacterium]